MLSWTKALRAKYDRVRAFLRAQEAEETLSFDYVDRAPGWLYVDTLYTLIPPSGYELDPAVVAFIRSFCPDYIPCWEKTIFLPPYDDAEQGQVIFVRHCIARHVADPSIGTHIFPKLETPPGYRGEWPNYLELVLTGDADPRCSDLPGLYKPLDFPEAERLRMTYDKFKGLSAKEYAAEILKPHSEKEFQKLKRARAERERNRYFMKSMTKYLQQESEKDALDRIAGDYEEVRKGYAFLKSPEAALKSEGV